MSADPGPVPPSGDDVMAAARRIAPQVLETPLVWAPDLGETLDTELWLKAENLQRTGSFKVRGAANWIACADDSDLAPGLVTVSAGNHALALAWAARTRGVAVTVVMPQAASPLKVDGTRALGAEVVLHGDVAEAVALAHRLRRERGLTLVHPYDDPHIIAGQGTVGLEILRQLPEAGRILCPVGGGGLVSGVAIAAKRLRPDVTVIGVEPAGAATLSNAWARNDAGAVLDRVDTIAASLAPVVAGRYTYAASRRWVDELVTVSEPAIREATRLLLTRARLYAETGASVGIAALLERAVPRQPERRTVCIVSGGNMDLGQVAELM